MKSVRFLRTLKNALFCVASVFMLAQCSNNEEAVVITDAELTATETIENLSVDDNLIASLTIDGINTILSSTTDCSTCSYTVPASATVVDGKELGIKPGQAICLDKAIKYGNLTFINLEGTAERPIIIAYGKERFSNLTVNPDILQSLDSR